MRFDTKILQRVAVFALIIITGCETDRVLFEGPYFVRFSESAETKRESFSKVIQIPVHLAGPKQDHDVVVRYHIAGDAREGVDYVILGDRESVVIEEGEYFGYIELQLINNSNNIIRSQEIVFTLTSTNDPNIQVGQGPGQMNTKFTFTIFDDCILGGDYKGLRSLFSIPVDGITITSEDCENYRLSNWNIDIFNTPFEMDLFFVDNADNTLTIPTQEEEVLPEDWATIRGTGTVDPITREIEMTIVLVDLDGQPEVTFTLIPD